MWQVSYVFKSHNFREYVIAHEDRDCPFRGIPRFLERAKERKYTNIRWRKV